MSEATSIRGAATRFADVHLVVVGSMNVDQITYCQRVPDEGETLVADRYEQGFGGKGANQAVMAARLGAAVSFVGCVGDDALGSATIENFKAHGVDTVGVRVVHGTATGVAPIWVDGHGSNRILIAPGANDALDEAHVLAALGTLERRPDLVLAQLETPQAATAAAFAWAGGVGVPTVLNPAPAAPLGPELLANATWLIPNESEFTLLFGARPDAESVTAAAGGQRLVVTLGADGAFVSDTGASQRVPARAVDAVDTTGAGDAFVGAFCVGLAAGLSPIAAAHLASIAGGLSVERRGTQTSFPDLDAVLRAVEAYCPDPNHTTNHEARQR